VLRVTWVQSEDLVAHMLAAKRLDGCDVGAVARRWEAAGGRVEAPSVGATAAPASDELGDLARALLAELATTGSICGALAGAAALPPAWVEPLANRLATSIPGFDGIGFDELARRTVAARLH
jgi:hypothetical protein